jgi:hypothetical protein
MISIKKKNGIIRNGKLKEAKFKHEEYVANTTFDVVQYGLFSVTSYTRFSI